MSESGPGCAAVRVLVCHSGQLRDFIMVVVAPRRSTIRIRKDLSQPCVYTKLVLRKDGRQPSGEALPLLSSVEAVSSPYLIFFLLIKNPNAEAV